MGISTVYQEVNLCPNLTVAENIFIGRQPMKYGQINWKEINHRAAELMERFNIHIDVTRPLVVLFHRHPADGLHRARGGHQGKDPDPGRTDLFAGRE